MIRIRNQTIRIWLGRVLRAIIILCVLGVLMIVYANVTAVWASRGRLFSDPSKLPECRAGLVFGTTDRINGRENLYFRYRIDAAVKVWNAGKIDTIIVSGSSDDAYYDEPDKMARALVRRGIPEDRIVPDKAGDRTLDSVVRIKEALDGKPVLFISQRFQNERAIYLAKAHGIKAFGFNAEDVDTSGGLKTKLREVGARVKMWLDVNILHTRPGQQGERIELPE